MLSPIPCRMTGVTLPHTIILHGIGDNIPRWDNIPRGMAGPSLSSEQRRLFLEGNGDVAHVSQM